MAEESLALCLIYFVLTQFVFISLLVMWWPNDVAIFEPSLFE